MERHKVENDVSSFPAEMEELKPRRPKRGGRMKTTTRDQNQCCHTPPCLYCPLRIRKW